MLGEKVFGVWRFGELEGSGGLRGEFDYFLWRQFLVLGNSWLGGGRSSCWYFGFGAGQCWSEVRMTDYKYNIRTQELAS